MSLLNTSSSVIHYLVLDEVPLAMGALVFAVGVLGGLLGRTSALYWVARTGRASLFVFALFAIMVVSVVIYAVYLCTEQADFIGESLCSE